MTSDLETYIVSVERIKEYMDCPKEVRVYTYMYIHLHVQYMYIALRNMCPMCCQAADVIESNRPPSYWPDRGEVEFQDYSTRYRPGLDLVLKDITCSIKSGEKVSWYLIMAVNNACCFQR